MLRKEPALNAALYVLNRLGETDMHKLFKILYFADREHFAKYGRPITGDQYIAMAYGPVPSCVYDAIKAAKGISCFREAIVQAKEHFEVVDERALRPVCEADTDYLSETDIECLDEAIEKYKDKTFSELVALSHQYAWHNTDLNKPMAVADILREAGCSEEQIRFAVEEISWEEALNNATA